MSRVDVQFGPAAVVEAHTGLNHHGYVTVTEQGIGLHHKVSVSAMDTATLRQLARALAEVADHRDMKDRLVADLATGGRLPA